jgi:RHS repeat-associated protein
MADAGALAHYNYFRDFDPAIGRYVQSDPIGLRGGINTYGYVSSKPLVLVDELGLDAGAGTLPRPPLPIPHPGLGMGMGELLGLCVRPLAMAFFVVGSNRGDACSDDPGRKRDECKTTRFDECRDQWQADTGWCDSKWSRYSRKGKACHDWADGNFGRCKNGQPRQPFVL